MKAKTCRGVEVSVWDDCGVSENDLVHESSLVLSDRK